MREKEEQTILVGWVKTYEVQSVWEIASILFLVPSLRAFSSLNVHW
jgi:hypothetical protein